MISFHSYESLSSSSSIQTTAGSSRMFRSFLASLWWCSCLRKMFLPSIKVGSEGVSSFCQCRLSCFSFFFFLFRNWSDLHPKGGLLTLFLHSPLTAICVLGKIKEIPYHLWETGQAFVDRFLAEASRLLTRLKGIGNLVSVTSSLESHKTFKYPLGLGSSP